MLTPPPRPAQWRDGLRLGNVGNDVQAWRTLLATDGYDLSGRPNEFETTTHNATIAWQRAHRLLGDGIVGAKTRDAISTLTITRPFPAFDPDAIRYIEAENWSRHFGAVDKTLIVVHCMEATEASTTAEQVAMWFAGKRGPAPKSSAHYNVDDEHVICCVPPTGVAWHAPGANTRGIGIEHAGYARQSREQWLDSFSMRMLTLSASLTAYLCDRFGIPIEFIAAPAVRAGEHGITTHAEVTKAFPDRGSHTDPGPCFPMDDYLRYVREAQSLRRAT